MEVTLKLEDVQVFGAGLCRPECVLATASGDLFTADWRGGIAHLKPDGSHRLYSGQTADLPEGLRPNGIALEADGSFLIANLGSEVGGVWRLDTAGQVRPVLTEVDGVALPPANFVTRDATGRLWLTISTRSKPRSRDYRRAASSGFIVLMDAKGARIVADGLGYTNECLVDPSGSWLYVNETFARRFSRFRLQADGSLGPKEVVTEFQAGQYPDGFAFDRDGHVWTTSVISNQLIRIALPSGRATVELEDSDPAHVDRVEAAYAAEVLDRSHMDTIVSRRLRNISSIAFGGDDLTTGYLGCLLGDHVYRLTMPVAGHPPVHWRYEVGT